MYADHYTDSMNEAIEETKRRREIQEAYNKEHGIIPKTIIKEIRDLISNIDDRDDGKKEVKMSKKEKEARMIEIENEMRKAAAILDFERAMELRDILLEMKCE